MNIEHIAMWVSDLEGMKKFYENYFSASSSDLYYNPKKQFSSYFLTFTHGTRLELMHMPSVPKSPTNRYSQFQGYIHIAVSVGTKEKVEHLTGLLKKDGYEVLDGPRTTGDGYYESVILDPEGNRIEITI